MREINVVKKPNGVPRHTAQGHTTSIAGFRIGVGEIAFDPDAGNFSDSELHCLVLASLGMDNGKIAKKLTMSIHTVKTHLRRAGENKGIVSQRVGYARHFFDIGVFKLTKPGESLQLTKAERPVVEEISKGKTNGEAGSAIGIVEATAKSHIARLATRTNLQGREQIVLHALVARDIGHYALYDINLTDPTAWTPDGGLIVPEPQVPLQREEMMYERS